MCHEYEEQAVCESCLGSFNYDTNNSYESVVKCTACRNDSEDTRDYDEDAEFCPDTKGQSYSSVDSKEFPF